MISRRQVSHQKYILSVVWLLPLLASALTEYDFPLSAEAREDSYQRQSQKVRELETLQSLLSAPDLTIEYKAPINLPADLTVRKRYGFAGLDNLDVIHQVMNSRQPEGMDANRESKYSLRQLMERHG